jgi:preprotein translocase subunit SecE
VSDTSTHTADSSGSGKPGKSGKSKKKSKPNIFARISRFIREVIAELRKVIWPTRRELITYTGVVLVFVLIMAGIVALLDFVFTQGVLAVFGG